MSALEAAASRPPRSLPEVLLPPTPTVFRPAPPVVLGLLGGIASGKSAVARLCAERGLAVLDADREVAAVLQQPEVQDELRRRFGPAVLRAGGGVDRARLAALVFDDPSARRDLEAITHPRVRAALERGLAEALARGASAVLDVPLLVEAGLAERCAALIFVAASPATRRARARARGWAAGELERRQSSQADLDAKRARADFEIDNDGPLEATAAQLDAILAQIAAAA